MSESRSTFKPSGIKDRTLPRSGFARSRRWVGRLQVIVSVALLALVCGGTILASWVAPYEPNAIALHEVLQPPTWEHWFGTDQLGRDVFSRVLWGGQISLFIGFCAVLGAGLIGSVFGLIAGYFGGAVDRAILWLADVQFSLPAVILALVLVGALGASLTNIIVVLSLASWARFARVMRSEALSLRSREFVLLAKLAGASPLRIVAQHILPNTLNTFIILATLDIGQKIILEATLSFLGLGVQPPHPSWGTMIADGRSHLEQAWWISVYPGSVLMVTILCCNLLGDTLRDRLSPHLRGRW